MNTQVINIGSGKYPANKLSNFTAHPFTFDGVACASMEGLLQAFKFDNTSAQVQVCALSGKSAKRKGKNRNRRWKPRQQLWWKGQVFERESKEYQHLLDRAFEALSTNTDFQKALLASGSATLIHNIGKHDPSDTVLTEDEFCYRLMRIRKRLQKQQR